MIVRVAEFDALVAGVAATLARARARLARREDELLAALQREPPLAVPLAGEAPMVVSALELFALRRHTIVDMTIDLPCRVVEVATTGGRRLGVRPRRAGGDAKLLRVGLVGDTSLRARLVLDGRTLRDTEMPGDAGPVPAAHIYLLSEADAAIVRGLAVDIDDWTGDGDVGADEAWLWFDGAWDD